MLAVEVDGKQHLLPERAAADAEKDLMLKTLGWTVVRIAWSNPNSSQGKAKLYPQLIALFERLKLADTCWPPPLQSELQH